MNYKDYFKQKLINEYNETALRRLEKLRPSLATAPDEKISRFQALVKAAGGRGGPYMTGGRAGPSAVGFQDPVVPGTSSPQSEKSGRAKFKELSAARIGEIRGSLGGRIKRAVRGLVGQNVKSTV